MLGKLLKLGRPRPPRAPDGVTVYAIGDIHGRADLLGTLHRRIAVDPAKGNKLVVYLGDYVDRGAESRQVVDLLLGGPPAGCRAVHLRGNHEQAMLDFREDWQVGADWLSFGGTETARSYGLKPPLAPDPESLVDLQKAVDGGVPAAHWAFFRDCVPNHVAGDYLFVHAGVRPGVPWDLQSPQDMMWIRDSFLRSRADHGKMVVHGHSISEGVEFRPNRIGIDTGAYYSNILTCLVLEGTDTRLIQT